MLKHIQEYVDAMDRIETLRTTEGTRGLAVDLELDLLWSFVEMIADTSESGVVTQMLIARTIAQGMLLWKNEND